MLSYYLYDHFELKALLSMVTVCKYEEKNKQNSHIYLLLFIAFFEIESFHSSSAENIQLVLNGELL